MPTNGPADRRLQQQRVAEMLRHLGLAPNGQPLAEAPGSLLRGRVDSPRYEPDLVQLQRATRAEAKSRAPGAGTFAELKPNAPKDGPVSLPKMLLERDQARNAELRREAAAEARRNPARVVDDPRERERTVYENLLPDNFATDSIVKLQALPATMAGIAAGSVNVLASRLAGNKDARITVGNNALQFENGWIGEPNSAFTAGNAVLYGPGGYPDRPSLTRYDGRATPVTLGDHEKGHTYQFRKPLFPARYYGAKFIDGLQGKPNRYEIEADDFGEEAYRRRK